MFLTCCTWNLQSAENNIHYVILASQWFTQDISTTAAHYNSEREVTAHWSQLVSSFQTECLWKTSQGVWYGEYFSEDWAIELSHRPFPEFWWSARLLSCCLKCRRTEICNKLENNEIDAPSSGDKATCSMKGFFLSHMDIWSSRGQLQLCICLILVSPACLPFALF